MEVAGAILGAIRRYEVLLNKDKGLKKRYFNKTLEFLTNYILQGVNTVKVASVNAISAITTSENVDSMASDNYVSQISSSTIAVHAIDSNDTYSYVSTEEQISSFEEGS